MDHYDSEIDLSGLRCPLPILRTKKEMASIENGKILRIIATDPGAVKDFEVFARMTGNTLLDSREEEGRYCFLIRKE